MVNIISIFLGGGVGAVLRYWLSMTALKHFSFNFPPVTLLINILGGLLIGFLYTFFVDKHEISSALKLALTVGFCGGFTTFSTFSLEMFEMIKNHQIINAFSYVFLSVIICLLAVSLGVYFGKHI